MKTRSIFSILGLSALALAACSRDWSSSGSATSSTKTKVLTSPPAAAKGALAGKTIAILATDGVEEIELVKPQKMFADQGAKTVVVSPKGGTIQGVNHDEKGDRITVDLLLERANPEMFDALVLPGGVANPDELRTVPKAVEFTKAFARAGKPISAICHGPWLLAEADLVRGRNVTSWPSLRRDLENAGAKWSDVPVVTDEGITTSRKPDDIDAFVAKSIEEFTEPQHQGGKHAAR